MKAKKRQSSKMKVQLSKAFYPDRQFVSLVAVDPGETIGVASATLLRDTEDVWDFDYSTFELEWPQDTSTLVAEALVHGDVIIIEDWRLGTATARSLGGSQLEGAQVVGYIRGYLEREGHADKLKFQQPAQMRGIESVIKDYLTWWPRSPHERDALLHLMVYLVGV